MKNRLALGVAAGAVVLLGVVGFVLFGPDTDLNEPAARLDQVVEDCQEIGFAFTADELAGPPPPEADNAAADIREFRRLYTDVEAADGVLERVEYRLLTGRAESPTELAQLEPLYPSLERAAARPRYWVQEDWDMAVQVELSDLPGFKTGVRLLGLRALRRAKGGQTEGALQDIQRMLRVADFPGQSPTLIGGLVRVACHARAYRLVQQIAQEWQRDPARLLRLREAIDGPPPDLRLYEGLRGTAYTWLAVLRNYAAFGGNAAFGRGIEILGYEVTRPTDPTVPDPQTLVRSGLPTGRFERANLCQALTLLRPIAEATRGKQPTHAQVKDRVRKAIRDLGNLDLYRNTFYQWTQDLERTSDSFFRLEADRQLTIALIDLLLGRAIKAIDPFDGKPIRYRKAGAETRLWSCDVDGFDNGGQLREESRAGESDLVVVFPARNPRSAPTGLDSGDPR